MGAASLRGRGVPESCYASKSAPPAEPHSRRAQGDGRTTRESERPRALAGRAVLAASSGNTERGPGARQPGPRRPDRRNLPRARSRDDPHGRPGLSSFHRDRSAAAEGRFARQIANKNRATLEAKSAAGIAENAAQPVSPIRASSCSTTESSSFRNKGSGGPNLRPTGRSPGPQVPTHFE